jgi:hypothetical protein
MSYKLEVSAHTSLVAADHTTERFQQYSCLVFLGTGAIRLRVWHRGRPPADSYSEVCNMHVRYYRRADQSNVRGAFSSYQILVLPTQATSMHVM